MKKNVKVFSEGRWVKIGALKIKDKKSLLLFKGKQLDIERTRKYILLRKLKSIELGLRNGLKRSFINAEAISAITDLEELIKSLENK